MMLASTCGVLVNCNLFWYISWSWCQTHSSFYIFYLLEISTTNISYLRDALNNLYLKNLEWLSKYVRTWYKCYFGTMKQ